MEEAYYHVDKDKLKKVKLMITESELSEKDKEIQNLIADGLLELLNPVKSDQKIREEIKKKIFVTLPHTQAYLQDKNFLL